MLIKRLVKTLVWLKNTLLDAIYWRASQREFQAQIATASTPDQVLNLLYNYQGHGFYKGMKPGQDKNEILRLAERLQALSPKVVVEIGTRHGGTLLMWSQCAPNLELLVSIDLPGGIHGGGYPAKRGKLYQLFVLNRPGSTLKLLRCNSQTETARNQLQELLSGRLIDFLFIDGDHRYQGVKKDYHLYASLVRPGGLIAFHDIRPNSHDQSIEVFRLWDEIKTQHQQAEEIIHEPYSGQYGIGLITV